MKKALLLIVLIAITLLTACKEDTGVGPVCPWQEDTKPDYRLTIDHYLGTIWAETKCIGTTNEGQITLYFAAKENRYCKVVPDYNQPAQDSTFVTLAIWLDGDQKSLNRWDRIFWTQYGDLLQFGGYTHFDAPYMSDRDKGYVYFKFLLQDTVTKKIYIINDKVRYKRRY